MPSITYEDKDKDNLDGIHNMFTDANANEVKAVVNAKLDTPAAGKRVVVHCGNYDATTVQYASSGGTGESGAVQQGNEWDIINGSVDSANIPVGSTIRAKIDNPGQTPSNWRVYVVGSSGSVESVTGDGVDNTDPDNPVLTFPTSADIGAEAVANKATSFGTINDTLYPSVKATDDRINAAVEGLQNKADSRVATTANITLSGIQTIDGVLLIAGDRVLVKDQSTAADNGIYISAVGAWVRSSDTNTGTELRGAVTSVDEGSTNSDTTWRQTADNITVGATAISWVQFGSSVPDATSTTKGKARLYPSTSLGANTDGAPDQNAVKVYVDAKVTQVITNGVTATAPSEDAVFDALALKQATLVSGTNIKTIDGSSVLGSGNIVSVQNMGNLLYLYNNFV